MRGAEPTGPPGVVNLGADRRVHASHRPMQPGKYPADTAPVGVWREYGHFLRHHPAWYLLPIAAVLSTAAWAVFCGSASTPSHTYPIF